MAARFIDNILVQNARMQSLVEKLLAQARLENRVEITPQTVRVDLLFTRLADARSAVLAAKEIALTLQPASLHVEGDPDLLEQALGNLLDNAIDFTRRAVLLNWRPGRCTGRYSFVTDSGSGIPDYALERIFERFIPCRARTG